MNGHDAFWVRWVALKLPPKVGDVCIDRARRHAEAKLPNFT
jgi:hypothetical protein